MSLGRVLGAGMRRCLTAVALLLLLAAVVLWGPAGAKPELEWDRLTREWRQQEIAPELLSIAEAAVAQFPLAPHPDMWQQLGPAYAILAKDAANRQDNNRVKEPRPLETKTLFRVPACSMPGRPGAVLFHRSGGFNLDYQHPDTYDVAGAIGWWYADYGDEEFLARKQERTPGPVHAERDWSNINGKNWSQ